MDSPHDAATCSNNLKGEDRARSAVADICGETVELFMVADGHGGAEVADLCAEHAFTYLVSETTATGDGSAASLEKALTRTFEHLHTSARAFSKTAGATLTIAAWNASRGEVTIANVGDSAGLLVEAAGSRLLTEEHRLSDSAAERERVLATGSQLGRAVSSVNGLPGGPLRCYPGGLAVCRAIGDADVGAAISAVPSVHTVKCDIAASGSALIICSDGVWDALTHDQVAKCTRQCASAAEAAKRVVDRATKARGLRDDITAAVAWLGTPPWSKIKSPSAGRRILQRLARNGSGSRGSGSDSDLSTSPNQRSPSPLSAKRSTPTALTPFWLDRLEQPSDVPSSPSSPLQLHILPPSREMASLILPSEA